MAKSREEEKPGVETGEKKAELLDAGVTSEAGLNGITCLLRVILVKRVSSPKGEMRSLREKLHSLMISLKLTQKELGRVREEMKKRDDLIESLLESAKMGTVGEQRNQRGPAKVTKRRRYEGGVQKCLFGFAGTVYDRVLEFAKFKKG